MSRWCARGALVFPLLFVVPVLSALAQQKPSDAKATAWQPAEGEWHPLPDIFPSGGFMKVMNGDPATGAADFYFRFPVNYGVPLHFHTPVERVFVDKGTMEFKTRDGRTLSLREGGFVHFPARAAHEARCTSNTDCYFFLNSSGPFDIHLIDAQGNVTESWSAAGAHTRN